MKNLCLLSVFVLCQQLLFAQIPNSGMEFWDNQPVLLQWQTNSRPLTAPAWNPYVIVKDTDKYSGSFAADFIGNGVFHAWAKTTFAIAQRPASLGFYYKYLFAPCVNDNGFAQQDTISVRVEILKDTTVVDSGYWDLHVSGFTPNYLHAVVPITQTGGTFDSCRITITGGIILGGCGIVAASTEFKVDQLELDAPAGCTNTGIVVQGLSCLLIDTGTGNLLMPCNADLGNLGFQQNDTIRFSFSPNACASICMQGTGIDITCLDSIQTQPQCNFSAVLHKHNPSSNVTANGYLIAEVVGVATYPVVFSWSNGTISGNDSLGGLSEGAYCVTITDPNACSAIVCDSLAGPHICIDSALICMPGGLCCDVPFEDPVCGCDSVTYMNGCIATYWGGVTSYYQGHCITTGVELMNKPSDGLFVSPVPAKDKLLVTYELSRNGKTNMRLLNTLGQPVKTFDRGFETAGRYRNEVELNNLSSGIYFVEIKTETERKIKMFVKE
jgi:hypothetical protein